ncbi:MAG: hypothetical protein SOH81_01895 [Acetobacter sp.]|jgi:hypothetical protein
MTEIANRKNELWLLDWFGRFLDCHPESGTIFAVESGSCPKEGPAIFLEIDSGNREQPFSLKSQIPIPLCLPQIRPEVQEIPSLALQILDVEGPFGSASPTWLGVTPEGAVRYDNPKAQDWEKFIAVPRMLGLCGVKGDHLRVEDMQGNVLPGVRWLSGFQIGFAGQSYAIRDVLPLLAILGALEKGESRDVMLPSERAGEPEQSVRVVQT